MKNIFYLTQQGIPSNNCGGSNKIIYLLLNGLNFNEFNAFYLSTESFIEYKYKFKSNI